MRSSDTGGGSDGAAGTSAAGAGGTSAGGAGVDSGSDRVKVRMKFTPNCVKVTVNCAYSYP